MNEILAVPVAHLRGLPTTRWSIRTGFPAGTTAVRFELRDRPVLTRQFRTYFRTRPFADFVK